MEHKFNRELCGRQFKQWGTEEELSNIREDFPFLKNTEIIPLPSENEDLIFLDSNGRFLLYASELDTVYSLGNSFEEGWENYKKGCRGNWSLVVNRLDDVTGEPKNDAAGLDVGITTLTLDHFSSDDDHHLLRFVENSINNQMPFVKNKKMAVAEAKRILSSLPPPLAAAENITVDLRIFNDGYILPPHLSARNFQ